MLSLLMLLACSDPAPHAPEAVAAPAPAEAPPAKPEVTPITAADLAEKLTEPSERPRVVNFWATWCAPCVKELPDLRDWARKNPEVELVLVDVDLFTLRKKKVEPFLAKHELGEFANYQIEDKDPAVALEAAIPEFESIVPFTLVIPASGGTERTAMFGLVEIPELEKTLASL